MRLDSTAAVFTVLASAVIVLTGLAALIRAIWRIAQNLRDNTTATQLLTGKLDGLIATIDGRFDTLIERIVRLEGHHRPGSLPSRIARTSRSR